MAECSHCQGALKREICVSCGYNPDKCTCRCSGCNRELTSEGKCVKCNKRPDSCLCDYDDYKKFGFTSAPS